MYVSVNSERPVFSYRSTWPNTRLNKKAVPNACAPVKRIKRGRIGTRIQELGGSRCQIESSLVTCMLIR